MDGQAERTIQTHEKIVRACIIIFKGSQYEHFLFVELSYNNYFNSCIFMATYGALYSRRCRSLIRWFKVDESLLLCPNYIYKTSQKVHIIRNQLQTAYSRQKSYADHRRTDLEFKECDKMYLKILPMKGV